MKTFLNRLARSILPAADLLLTGTFVSAATTIDATDAHAYAANIGWINVRGDVTNGAVIGEFVCSGFIYSANCGWISLGGGAPANGIRYQNNSAADFGVNTQDYFSTGTTFEAKLRGFAYGANIGWVNFESTGNPRVNLATGQLLGFAYGANVGWIALSGTGVALATTSLQPGADSDADGIPDAWERLHAGNIAVMNAATDSDKDGEPDTAEYAADTDPLDPYDRLLITDFVPPRQLVPAGPFQTTLTWTSKPSRRYRIESNPNLLSAWDLRVTNIVPASGITTTNTFNDPTDTRRFFQVTSELPLTP